MILLTLPEKYMLYSVYNIVLMLGFNIFVLARLHRYSLGITLIRMILFTFLFLIGYLGLGLLMNLLALLTGIVTVEDFLPPSN